MKSSFGTVKSKLRFLREHVFVLSDPRFGTPPRPASFTHGDLRNTG
jgi:hypothetical protein